MSDHSRDAHQSFEKVFQKDTIKEFDLIDPSFLAHVDDIMSELDLQFLETIEQPTSSRAEHSLKQPGSSADCLSQGKLSYSPPSRKTSSDIPCKAIMKTRIKKRTRDLMAKKYNGLNEEQAECKRLKVNAQVR
ncbi:hypothetical protein PoB_006885000 [Plakobranchus ocellatus]|uniref:Uncharacterized protein n=1 Tax=Plakobranchus ocellatus TaxID=259542 RepID=A0AAV4DEF3_9GAST|nr:hypothetical protein PoB_006885000 [Plakobranchus ocellatus]